MKIAADSLRAAAAVVALLACGIVAAPVHAADMDKDKAAQASLGNVTPQQFATQAAEGGLAEVQLSQLAQKQANSAEVRQFADRMVTDHGAANTELMAIAKQKNMTLPKSPNAEHQATMKTLQGKKGADFDAAYMAAMKKDHVKSIALFQAATGPSFTDSELKAFASKTLPVIQEHHTMIEHSEGKSGSAAAAASR